MTDASHPVGEKIACHFIEQGYSLILGTSTEGFTQSMREKFLDREIYVFHRDLTCPTEIHSFYSELKKAGHPVAAIALSERGLGSLEDVQIFLAPIQSSDGLLLSGRSPS